MEADFALWQAVFLDLGIAVAADFGTFVAACEVEVGTGLAMSALQLDLGGIEFDLPAIGIELDVARAEHVDFIDIQPSISTIRQRASTADGRLVLMLCPPAAWAGVPGCRPRPSM